MEKVPHYYVDSNILIYLGFIDYIVKSCKNIPESEIREKFVSERESKISRDDLNAIFSIYKKAIRGEVQLVVTPSVIFEMARTMISGNYPGPTPGCCFMLEHCVAKCPEQGMIAKYAGDVRELGERYHKHGMFMNRPKDFLDQTIMAEVAVDEHAKYIRVSDLNLTQLFFEIAQKHDSVFEFTGEKEKYTKAFDASEAFKKILFSDPAYLKAAELKPELVKDAFITIDSKQFIRPKYKKVPAPEIIGSLNEEFTSKKVQPKLPSEEFHELGM